MWPAGQKYYSDSFYFQICQRIQIKLLTISFLGSNNLPFRRIGIAELVDMLKYKRIIQCRQITQITFEFGAVLFCLFFFLLSLVGIGLFGYHLTGLITYLLQVNSCFAFGVFILHNMEKPSLSLLFKCIQIAN